MDGSDAGQNIVYLTRADFAGTFPKKVDGRTLGEKAVALNLYTAEMTNAWINEDDAPVTFGARNGLSIEKDGKLTDLGKKLGGDYNAAEWDALLDQMTLDEMMDLTLHGYCNTRKVESIGKPSTVDSDGPAEYGSFGLLLFGLLNVVPYQNTGFPNADVIAQTWNLDLAEEMGRACGTEAGVLGTTAVMSSYNRIGAVWTGGSEAMLTGILRGEWGFQGVVITSRALSSPTTATTMCT